MLFVTAFAIEFRKNIRDDIYQPELVDVVPNQQERIFSSWDRNPDESSMTGVRMKCSTCGILA